MLKPKTDKEIVIIGGGLAGSEAALLLTHFNLKVTLIDMKPQISEGVFHSPHFGELVCSNSLRSQNITNGAGLLKKELAILNSPLIEIAHKNQIAIGDSLVVNREEFSKDITKAITTNPNIKVISSKLDNYEFSNDKYYLIATGPATSDEFFIFLNSYFKSSKLAFIDATAPVIDATSIDYNIAYYKNRFDEETPNKYLNCPLTKDEYNKLYDKLLEYSSMVNYEQIFEGCMPVESLAKRGYKTLLFGPLKPIGLEINNERPFAVVQLRPDNNYNTLFNIVGFQTGLKESYQKEIINLIPGLKNAKVFKYGRMHKSKYLNSPELLTKNYQFKDHPNIYLIGQINGIEGYIEAISSGHVAALDLIYKLSRKELILTNETLIGGLMNYAIAPTKNYIPIKANYGIIKPIMNNNKIDRSKQAEKAIAIITKLKGELYE